jgi:ubiquinone biosynthesis protein Coq4
MRKSQLACFIKYYQGYEIKEDEMGGHVSSLRQTRKCKKSFLGKWEEYLEKTIHVSRDNIRMDLR